MTSRVCDLGYHSRCYFDGCACRCHSRAAKIADPELTRREAIALIDSGYKGVAFNEKVRRGAISKLKVAVAQLDAVRRARYREAARLRRRI